MDCKCIEELEYTAVIRTLGTAGASYRALLDSLCAQTIKPKRIIVYIAEGYPLPLAPCGRETYIHVAKGMVAQRALRYDEVDTEYMLLLDDDLWLPADLIESMFKYLCAYNADVISPDIYPNHRRSILQEVMMTVSGRMRARRYDHTYGYKVMSTSGYSYNKKPDSPIYISNTNAGACCLCRKKDLLRIDLADELWMDRMTYAIGEDQVMFYKMHLCGLKQLTYYHSGIRHLDAGHNLSDKANERQLVENDYYFRRVFFQRFLLEPEKSLLRRLWKISCISYFFIFGLLISLIKGDTDMYRRKIAAITKAKNFIASREYQKLPKIKLT